MFIADRPDMGSERQSHSDSDQDSCISEKPENAIDEEALAILGKDPSLETPREVMLHPDLASRWKAFIVSGVDKETRGELLKNYPRGGNCPLEPPILNPEFISSLNETAVKRDKHFTDSQCLIGSAMSALGSAITLLLDERKEGVDRNELLKFMCDAGKLLADLHHKESTARKAYILPGLDKKAKTLLGKTQTDRYLFGEDLSEKLKSAKAMEKAGLDLKLQPAISTQPKIPFKKSNSVNWKSPPVKFQKFQRTGQVGSNQRGPNKYKSGGNRSQENQRPNQIQTPDEKSSKGRN